MSHSPEVLADLVARMRRDPDPRGAIYRRPPPKDLIAANVGTRVHMLDRADLEALIASRCPPLEVDHHATSVLCPRSTDAP